MVSELATSCEPHSTMVDGNKFKIVDEHCKRLDNQLQTYHLEWQESMAENKEQGAKIEQLVIQMELLSSQFQQFVAAQTARTEMAEAIPEVS